MLFPAVWSFSREELPQIRHATNDGTRDGAGTGEENTDKQDERPGITPRSRAKHHKYAYRHTTKKEPDPSTSERTKQRATHETPPIR